MSFSIKEFEHLKIPFEDIKLATKDFTYCIGEGGFGKVYKGELVLTEAQGLTLVAVKRLNSSLGQGAPEFWREIMLLTRYKHDNLVSLLGYCNEVRENILVYEYLPNKSLDRYLSSTNLSWYQRLRICLGAAHGLQYLHEPFEGSQQRVLHRDIKSGNILLDENWKPKISDFGLSKFGPANQQFTYQFSNAVGTMGYCDPLYAQTGFLTKESDIYSFGAILFEVLCGRQCVQISFQDNRRFLPVLARKCFEEQILDTIVDNSLKDKISPQCLEGFSKIAYQCLWIDRTERPLVTELVKELEIALQYQEEYELMHSLALESVSDLEVIIKTFENPDCTSNKELLSFLHKGILFDLEKKFFWINDDGIKCLSVSSISFLDARKHKSLTVVNHQRNSRFPTIVGYYDSNFFDVHCQIKTSMLSLGTMYEARLVVKYPEQPRKWITIVWKTAELCVRFTQPVELTTDNWCMVKMWRFINHGLNADFDITIERLFYPEGPYDISFRGLLIQGIEFHPIDMMENESIEAIKCLVISDDEVKEVDDDEYWEKKLPDDYKHYIEMSDKHLDYATKKELYFILCDGFHCDNGQLWISLCKSTYGICCMLSATEVLRDDPKYEQLERLSLSESRFGEAIIFSTRYTNGRDFNCKLRSTMFSPHHTYGCYLVCKLEDNQKFPFPKDKLDFGGQFTLDGEHNVSYFTSDLLYCDRVIYPMNIPTISPNHGLPNIPKSDEPGSMEQGEDGWTKVLLCKPRRFQDHKLLSLRLSTYGVNRIIVAGIEFRPCIMIE